jgi:hypothetical protein
MTHAEQVEHGHRLMRHATLITRLVRAGWTIELVCSTGTIYLYCGTVGQMIAVPHPTTGGPVRLIT